MPGGDHCAHSSIGLAMTAAISEPVVRDRLRCNPTVRILVINAERSTTKCRLREQFPMTVNDRQASPLIRSLETRWTICDLEDVVMQRADRRMFVELEECKLRSAKGIYGQKGDDLHFRKDVAVAAGDELIKACRRTALSWYAEDLKHGDLLLILAAGWNSNGTCYSRLNNDMHAWRKAEAVALADLCALNGHPFSSVREKMTELLARADGRHCYFLNRSLADVAALPPPPTRDQGRCEASNDRPGHLEGWLRKRRWSEQNLGESVGGASADSSKRAREAAQLAGMMSLPIDTAESILDTAGSLDAALALPLFQASQERTQAASAGRASASSSWGTRLHGGCGRRLEVIDLELEDVDGEGSLCAASQDDVHLQQLAEMGFTKEQAAIALRRVGGDFARAIELLL